MTDNPLLRKPAGKGDKFDTYVYKGSLLLVFCTAYQEEVKTSKGQSSEAVCDIIVVDRVDPATNMPEFFDNAKLWGNLARSVGRGDGLGAYTFGWLDQVATSGGNEAWILKDATEDPQAVAQATPWVTAHQQKRFVATVKPPSATAATAGNWQQDAWAGMGQTAPAAGPPAAATPVPPSAPAAAEQQDPNIIKLISAGLNPSQVISMDAATRAAVAATL